MLYNQNCWPYYTQYREMEKSSYIRLLHASPGALAVDVYANNKPLAKNLAYKDFTQYLSIPSGNYNITVFPTGKKNNPLSETALYIPPHSIFTIAASGSPPNLTLLAIPEPIKTIPQNKLYIRFAHLSPDAPNVDVVLPNGTKLFRNVSFKEFTDYMLVGPGKYTFEIRPFNTQKTVLYVPNVNLKPGRYYTVYAVGLASGKPSLQALIPMDGNSYLKF